MTFIWLTVVHPLLVTQVYATLNLWSSYNDCILPFDKLYSPWRSIAFGTAKT